MIRFMQSVRLSASRPGSIRRGRFATACATLLILLTCAAVSANIVIVAPPAGVNYVPTVPVAGLPAGATGTVTLNPAASAHLNVPAAGSNFLTTFTADVAQYPGWTAVSAAAALNGTLTISRYQALSPTGSATLLTPNGGARMEATYAVNAGDGLALTDLKWIQMFTDNTGPGGALVRHIDPFPNDDTRPWYLTAAEDGGTLATFLDRPGDHIATIPFSRTLRFETYLASFNNATKVATIYDGFSWGYDIAVVPEPSTWMLLAIGGALMALRRIRVRSRQTKLAVA